MFNVFSDINWLAVVLAAIASLALGGLYFVVLIAKPYLVALGREDQPAPQSSPARDIGPLICTILVTITSAILIEALDITSTGDALVFGLIVGVGYLSAMTFQIALNPNFPRPLYYGVLNAPYFLIASLVTSLVIVAFR